MQRIVAALNEALAKIIPTDTNEHAVVARAVRLLETVDVELTPATPVPSEPDPQPDLPNVYPDTVVDETR